ncbi:MAG: DNA polymerase III subunit delta, partial [Thermomicrobium sp.]
MFTVLHGNSELLRRETLASLTNREDPSGFATTRFPPGTPLASIAAAARTPAFFAERRLIVTEGLLSEALRLNTLSQELLELLRTLPESCHLITIEPPLTQELIQRLTTHLGLSVQFLSCTVPSGKEIVSWVRERARSYGVEIEPDAAEEFVLAVAPMAREDRRAENSADQSETNSVDLTRIDTELAKLAAAVYPATVIRVADVHTFVSPDEPPLEWALIDAVQRGQSDVIVRELERALGKGTSPELLLGQLTGYFEGLLAALTQPDLSP